MKIDLDWIQKELDAGREVSFECVDSNRFLGAHTTTNKLILRQENLIVESVFDNYGIFLKGELKGGASNYIHRKEFECFRIKQAPTFDDLIDVLIKAKKDNIVSRVEINGNSLNATVNLTDSKMAKFRISKDAGGIVFKERIDWINSLYTETFVIESESDTNKLISGDKIVLKNGEVLEFSNNYKGCLWFNHSNYETEVLFPFVALKGATVTQKRR